MGNLEKEVGERAQGVIEGARRFGVEPFIKAKDVQSANEKLHTMFCCQIFNHRHGLPPLEAEQLEEVQKITDLKDIEGDKWTVWANSLGLKDEHGADIDIKDLYAECQTGLLLLRIMDKVQPGVVDWKQVNMKVGDNQMKMQLNCGVAVDTAVKMGCKVVGVTAGLLKDKNKKSILAIVWQIVRMMYLKLIGDGDEKVLIEWANNVCGDASLHASSIKDKTLSNAKLFLAILNKIDERYVVPEEILPGDNDEEKEKNASYAIAIARTMGAVIYCVPEDIAKVNDKMILVFLCTLKELFDKSQAGN